MLMARKRLKKAVAKAFKNKNEALATAFQYLFYRFFETKFFRINLTILSAHINAEGKYKSAYPYCNLSSIDR